MKRFLSFIRAHLPMIFLVGILALAAYLRLYKIENYLTFLGDEGRDVLVVKRIIVDHKFTLLGPTASVGGFFLGPIYYYFMLPFLWAWNLEPVGPAIMVALFGIATVYVVFMTARAFWGTLAGLIASSLFAVSPLVIAYSRSSWNPNVVPFFSTLLIYLLWRLVEKKNIKDAFWIGIVLGIGIQLHYLFLFLFVVVGSWYILKRNVLPFVQLILWTLVGFLVGVSPFLAFELRHGFTNTRFIIQFIFAGKETGVEGSYLAIVSDVVFRAFGRILFRYPQPEILDKLSPWYIWALRFSAISALVVTLLAFVGAARGAVKKIATPAQLMLLWFIVPVVLFGFYNKSIYDYYFGIFFAFPALALGYVGSKMYERVSLRFVVIALWAGLLFFNWQGRPFIHAPNNQLAQVRSIARTAYEQAGGKPFNFALITGGNSDHAYRYFFEIWGNSPTVIQNTDVDPERKSVTDQLIVICEDPSCQPLGHPLWEVAGFGRAEIAGSWDVPFVKIYRLVHYEGEQ
jgi:4-amino-4-deoxy-L-arabinose transferase-like glycosyltransferase